MFASLKINLIWCDVGYSCLLSVTHSGLVVRVLELEPETQRSDLSRGDFNLKCFVPHMKRTVVSAGVAHWHEPMGQKEIQKLGYSGHYAFLMTGTEHALHGRVPLKAFGKRVRRTDQVAFFKAEATLFESDQRRRKMGLRHNHPQIWIGIPHQWERELKRKKNHKTLGIPLSGKSPLSIPHESCADMQHKNAFLGSGILWAIHCWLALRPERMAEIMGN